jgi:hypothetical protein
MKHNTPVEVMKAIADNGGRIGAYVSNGADWKISEIVGVNLIDQQRPFLGISASYKYCSIPSPYAKKSRPMTARELALWMIEHPTYAVTCKDWGNESWTHDITWVTAMAKNTSNWLYADFEDLDFPQWQSIPEVEDEK